jgi:hypothetical protein
MAGGLLRNRKVLGGLVLTFLLAGGVAWLERTALLSWLCVHGLCRSCEAGRACWVRRVARLGEPAVPALVDCLRQPDPAVCRNVQAGLAGISNGWGAGDARSVELTLALARSFARFSPAGQRSALELPAAWFDAPRPATPAAGLVLACARLLSEAAGVSDPEALEPALELGGLLLQLPQHAQAISAARDLARAGLRSRSPDNRLRAVRLSLHPGLDVLDQVAGLLNDPAAEVRRAAILAVGSADQVVRDEGLLPSLHDHDPEVRRLCEAALRGRGLRPEHLRLARLLTDPRPGQRLRVIDYLRPLLQEERSARAADLDPGLWLRRLSHDPSPAVRAAALRLMSRQRLVDLSDRIDQMARTDPSPTVCQLAQFYQKQQQHRPAARGMTDPR